MKAESNMMDVVVTTLEVGFAEQANHMMKAESNMMKVVVTTLEVGFVEQANLRILRDQSVQSVPNCLLHSICCSSAAAPTGEGFFLNA